MSPGLQQVLDRAPAPVLETHDGAREKIRVLREDLAPGGLKMRFLPFLVQGADEVVYGSPFCGGAALALSEIGKQTGQRMTLFYAKRAEHHPRQIAALQNGARIFEISPGYMTNVQAKARAYAAQQGALFLPLGFDVPAAAVPLIAFLNRVRLLLADDPSQVWCATGSGMLARYLGLAFPRSEVIGIAVGLKSRHEGQAFGRNVRLRPSAYDFEKQSKASAPFPSCGHYDRKAWELCSAEAKPGALFVNVMG